VSEPSWQAALPEIAKELRGYLASRLPSRSEDHDDLVNETLLALSQWMRRHEGMPLAMTGSPSPEHERRALSAFAKVVLKRRIVDRFRLESREWRRRVDLGSDWLAGVPDEARPAERTILLRRMLEITIGVLATMKPEDRDLIAFATAGFHVRRGLTPRERQRLRRVRSRIAAAIVAELGAPAAELLRREE
jgi:DNA-directed RNA polymerase specialized sigma24 family protein